MANLQDTYTHITDLKGKIKAQTSPPSDTDIAGIAAGEIYYDSDSTSFYVYNGSTWQGQVMTTTSTSTSTSTSTTTTT